MKAKEIILTVQPARNKRYGIFRLGINTEDSVTLFFKPLSVILILVRITVEVNIVCGPPSKKCYDVGGQELNNWIKKMGFDDYTHRKPTKLKFLYSKKNDKIYLKYISKI